MPRNKDLKRLVRARMKKTGEAYTAARAQILTQGRAPNDVPHADCCPPRAQADRLRRARRHERRNDQGEDRLHLGALGVRARPLRRAVRCRTARSRSS